MSTKAFLRTRQHEIYSENFCSLPRRKRRERRAATRGRAFSRRRRCFRVHASSFLRGERAKTSPTDSVPPCSADHASSEDPAGRGRPPVVAVAQCMAETPPLPPPPPHAIRLQSHMIQSTNTSVGRRGGGMKWRLKGREWADADEDGLGVCPIESSGEEEKMFVRFVRC